MLDLETGAPGFFSAREAPIKENICNSKHRQSRGAAERQNSPASESLSAYVELDAAVIKLFPKESMKPCGLYLRDHRVPICLLWAALYRSLDLDPFGIKH